MIDDPQGPQECTIQPLSSGIPTIVIAIAIAIAIAVVIVIAMAIAVAVVIAVDALDETELILALFDTGEDRVVNAEDTDDGGQIVTYEVAADVIDVAIGIGGGAFELDIRVE